jgi:quercetin dioxygenase-like cupin family protein
MSLQSFPLESFTKGWFVGHFQPTLIDTQAVEVAIKRYRAGDREKTHYHRVATELTAVISGKIRMSRQEFQAGDIVKVEPGQSTDFEALEDTVTVVIKHPGAPDDKYVDE